ncbi:ATP-dependent DNA helicase PIF1-like [Anoplophora glabripennis]|uniref:ATP-dependent DNA helicase PIF1-like n=1 Tax=Anoplophora glabripennis TaxID=217634 RepID=UPI0008759446|nr:ATP-dependent DNA helicase PIF1-like [Anoplophora glabripennis]
MGRPNVPMGGKVFLLGGDFRQTLPVVPHGGRAQVVSSCLKASPLWRAMRFCSLSTNVRVGVAGDVVGGYVGDDRFAEWLLRLGEDRIPHETLPSVPGVPEDIIRIPDCFVVADVDALLDFVYPQGVFDGEDVADRVILCPTNAVVNDVNKLIVGRLPGEAVSYFSTDVYEAAEEDDLRVPQDLLNSITTTSLPPHELTLKVGTVVMLLNNLDIEQGLCNGTRLIVSTLGDHVLECRILTGERRGSVVWIPKVTMIGRDNMLPKEFKRTQYPMRVAYAMTVNKSQGQTFSRVGVYLKRPCFSHGQMYVAFSRVDLEAEENIPVTLFIRQRRVTNPSKDVRISGFPAKNLLQKN